MSQWRYGKWPPVDRLAFSKALVGDSGATEVAVRWKVSRTGTAVAPGPTRGLTLAK
jgi:hypothetical protein